MGSGLSWPHFFVNNVVLYLGILYLCKRDTLRRGMSTDG